MNKVGLVGCVKGKQSKPAPAKELYISDLFLKRRAYVERCYDSWVILSAKHHVISPDELLEPYDETLKAKSAAERRSWSRQVFEQLQQRYLDQNEYVFYFHAGKEYRQYLIPLLKRHSYYWQNPLEGLSIGKQLSWYNKQDQQGSC